jgi:hypothetical protein
VPDNPFNMLTQGLTPSPFGRFGCDPPSKLVELMLNKLKHIEPDVDLILVSGDFLSHGFAVNVGHPDHYLQLKETIEHVFTEVLGNRFPNAIILPAIGNNDIKFHYQAPRQDGEAKDYYGFLSDVLFNKVPGNKNIDTKVIKQTFSTMGYYRYDLHDTCDLNSTCLSIIAINSLYYSTSRSGSEPEIMQGQLDWLSAQLKTAEAGRKFIIFMHIYPGEYQQNKETYFWEEEFTVKFMDITESNNDRIMIVLGAHTHFTDIRINIPYTSSVKGFLSKNSDPEAKFALLATPSISPNFINNPGFTTFKISENVVKNIKLTFFELNKFPSQESDATFNTLDFAQELGLDIWNPKEVQKAINNLQWSFIGFYRFIAHKIGYFGLLETVGIALHMAIGSIGLFSSNVFYCASRHVRKADFEKCVGK